MGNFIFQTETVSLQPADAYQNKGMPHDTMVGEYMNNRSQNGTKGYCVLENIWRSVMAGFTAEDGKITQIQLYPITLSMGAPRSKMGNPKLSDESVLQYLAELSAPAVEQKLAKYLSECEERITPNMAELAATLGIGRASLYRTLDDFIRRGLIRKQDHDILILEPDELRKLI